MPQGSSAVRLTNGLYLYLFFYRKQQTSSFSPNCTLRNLRHHYQARYSHKGTTCFLLNNQPDKQINQIYCYKTLHVSGIFSAHHQEFSTVHSALLSFMQVYDDHIQAESGWNCSSILTLLGEMYFIMDPLNMPTVHSMYSYFLFTLYKRCEQLTRKFLTYSL